jgi:outer membrane protein OmpA-like peptidoglycan-associated protein
MESTTFSLKFELERSEATYLVTLNNIHYDFDKWDIRPDAANELGRVVNFLNTSPTVNIEMRSHTDSRGSAVYNMYLSQKRAASAVDFLRYKGISPSRYTAVGLGENELLNACGDGVQCSKADHMKNRRTEFKVIVVQTQKNALNAYRVKK